MILVQINSSRITKRGKIFIIIIILKGNCKLSETIILPHSNQVWIFVQYCYLLQFILTEIP
jgi:hypothetical protein